MRRSWRQAACRSSSTWKASASSARCFSGSAYRKDRAVDINNRSSLGLPRSTIQDGDNASASVTLRQTLYDFGRTAGAVRVEELNLDASRLDYDSAALTITYRVRIAYYDVLRAVRTRDVEAESVSAHERHLQQARDFYEAGTRPRYDVTKAELDLSNAQLNLIESENGVKLTWVELNSAMGLGRSAEYLLEAALDFNRYDLDQAAAVPYAFEHRPDFLSLQSRLRAAEAAVRLARTGYNPELSALGAYRFDGRELPLDNGWSLGLTMRVNLFNGFATSRRIDQAMAAMNTTRAQIESRRLDMQREIEQSFLSLELAQEAIGNAEIQVKLATENLELANSRYEAGVGDPVEVADAIVAMSRSKLAHVRALYQYKVAQAGIERAIAKR